MFSFDTKAIDLYFVSRSFEPYCIEERVRVGVIQASICYFSFPL